MRRRLLLILPLLVALGCGAGDGTVTQGPTSTAAPAPAGEQQDLCARPTTAEVAGDPGSLTVIVSNQSFDEPEVDVAVRVDGIEVICETFAVEGQHTWKAFAVPVDAGDHRVTAESSTGATAEVDVPGMRDSPRWVLVDHWASSDEPTHLAMSVTDEPPGFA